MSPSRLLLVLGLVALCAACGRRGPLEAPHAAAPAPSRPAAAASASATASEDEDPTLPAVPDTPGVAQPSAQSSGNARKRYTIPPGPFPLDPLL
ncbi:lipoprotein [Methylobacterium sp. JK268]